MTENHHVNEATTKPDTLWKYRIKNEHTPNFSSNPAFNKTAFLQLLMNF